MVLQKNFRNSNKLTTKSDSAPVSRQRRRDLSTRALSQVWDIIGPGRFFCQVGPENCSKSIKGSCGSERKRNVTLERRCFQKHLMATHSNSCTLESKRRRKMQTAQGGNEAAMPMPILATKLYIPRLRPHLVSRPRLIER